MEVLPADNPSKETIGWKIYEGRAFYDEVVKDWKK